MRGVALALCFSALCIFSHVAKADAIAGSTVAGKLVVTGQGKYNQFSTTGGTAAVNATVGSGVEFSETEYVMEDFADFTGTGLTVTIACIKTVNCSGVVGLSFRDDVYGFNVHGVYAFDVDEQSGPYFESFGRYADADV